MIYDVVIVGTGPAGMSAAVKLSQRGLAVLIVDEQPTPGGQIWRGIERNTTGPILRALGRDYEKGRALAASFRACGAEYAPNTQVWQIEEGWSLYLSSNGKARRIVARAVLLANGAQERPVPFQGWTLPGVMTVGAAQILLKSGGMLPQGQVWIAGAGPLPLLYATQALNLGATITGYLDTSLPLRLKALSKLPGAWRDIEGLAKGFRWLRELEKSGRLIRRTSGLMAQGDGKLQDIEWQSGGVRHKAKADVLLVHEGVVPRIHETLALGCAHAWNRDQNYLAPKLDRWGETSRVGLFVAGDAGGIGGWAAATIAGEIAALGIAGRLGVAANIDSLRQEARLDVRRQRALALRPFLNALYSPPGTTIPDDVIVCRCEEVTAGKIRDATRGMAPDPNAVKAATRCGMGPCQGRQCGYSVQAILAEQHGIPACDVSFFNIRPPLKPVTIGELASIENAEEIA